MATFGSESGISMYSRRMVTVPLFFSACALGYAVAPFAIPGFMVYDTIRRNRQALTRTYLMLLVYLSCQVIGVTAAGWLWLRYRGDRETYIDKNYALEFWWGRTQFNLGRKLYALRVLVEGDDAIPPGPFILLIRHVSTFDNLIPVVLVSDRHGTRLRWVLNRPLLRDPCIDIVGNRLPNCFVQGGTKNSAKEIARVGKLGVNLGPGEGVSLYPEGALFSPSKRRRILEKMREEGELLALADAAGLRSVLPPRLGGFKALLEASDDADIVFCAHAGLEGTAYRSYIAQGSLVGSTLRVKFWRVPRAELPENPHDWARWLNTRWAELDEWVSTTLGVAKGEVYEGPMAVPEAAPVPQEVHDV